jgi:hypothetical protein
MGERTEKHRHKNTLGLITSTCFGRGFHHAHLSQCLNATNPNEKEYIDGNAIQKRSSEERG